MKIERTCGKCGGMGKLKRTIFSNGSIGVSYKCDCGHSSSWISHEKLEGSNIEILKLPIYEQWNLVVCCEVKDCSNWGYEWHHIAPRHLFGDEAGLWPVVKLCKAHHTQWHDVVTPNMTSRETAQ